MTRQDQAEAARIVVGLEPPSERVTVDDVRRTGDALREPRLAPDPRARGGKARAL